LRIGIDLGTAYSLAVLERRDGEPELVPDCTNASLFHTASLVTISDQHALVGRFAEKAIEVDPKRSLIAFFKQDLGKSAPLWIDPRGTRWYPEAIAALMLKKLRIDAEIFGGASVSGAVITVPAHFLGGQRKALLAAAAMADLDVVDLIDEPVAAALHYGRMMAISQPPAALREFTERPVFVYDFGGGTFDATVIKLAPTVEVLAKVGMTTLGGRDVDDKVMQSIIDQWKESVSDQISANELFRLRKISEEVKIDLCTPGKSYVTRDVSMSGRATVITVKRDEFVKSIGDLVEQTVEACRHCLREAGVPPEVIHKVILVGGSSWLPTVKERLREVFGNRNQQILFHDPTTAVALGAGLHLYQLGDGKKMNGVPEELKGVTGYCVGLRAVDVSSRREFVDTLINRNRPLPCRAAKRYFTSRSDQRYVRFEVLQYYEMGGDTSTMGELSIGPVSKPHLNYPIDVSVECRKDGTVAVSACDAETGESLSQTFGDAVEEATRFERQRSLVRSVSINTM